jgi:catechol 2,3-dioxygenase-like lactoylglutathione lyase family enzyme
LIDHLFRTSHTHMSTPGSFKPVIDVTITIQEGGRLRHLFFDVGAGQQIGFLEPNGVPDIPAKYDAGINRGLGVPTSFYHFAFEAGSPVALAQKRDELRDKGVEATDIIDHGLAQSIYFKDPNDVSLEYCCMVGDRPEPGALIHIELTHPRAALELTNRPASGEELSQRSVATERQRGGHCR